MPEISATDAARRFAAVLDAVEHRRERFTVVRRGHVVAEIRPAAGGVGAALKVVLRTQRDDRWASELAELRAASTADERR